LQTVYVNVDMHGQLIQQSKWWLIFYVLDFLWEKPTQPSVVFTAFPPINPHSLHPLIDRFG
jgi:hypothetical protein